ncbi:hypothetical protein, partial [Pseudomonas sp. UBA7456]|uniref:hypothetical protein n=1 Tax=Pseudomonas sp. UBA7456 TaxID=1947339 RepID=UPI00257CEC3D
SISISIKDCKPLRLFGQCLRFQLPQTPPVRQHDLNGRLGNPPLRLDRLLLRLARFNPALDHAGVARRPQAKRSNKQDHPHYRTGITLSATPLHP